jgi:hypothetical protein
VLQHQPHGSEREYALQEVRDKKSHDMTVEVDREGVGQQQVLCDFLEALTRWLHMECFYPQAVHQVRGEHGMQLLRLRGHSEQQHEWHTLEARVCEQNVHQMPHYAHVEALEILWYLRVCGNSQMCALRPGYLRSCQILLMLCVPVTPQPNDGCAWSHQRSACLVSLTRFCNNANPDDVT